MTAAERLTAEAKKWEGYLEKASNKDLDDFTANAGKNNYTCFARDYYSYTGENYQAQPWCAMFVSVIFVIVFGLEMAKKLLCGALFSYCPTGVNQFKAKGRWRTSPAVGAVIFFTNGTRAYHTGIVTGFDVQYVYTFEGNTSGGSSVIENGGAVCAKKYRLDDPKILGYGLPDYSIVPIYQVGWNKDEAGWWYSPDGFTYLKSCWEKIKSVQTGETYWYHFKDDGYMNTGFFKVSEAFFYAEESGPLEGALWHGTSANDGSLERWVAG